MIPMTSPTIRERFDAAVSPEPNTGCWLWTRSLATSGYGVIGVGGRGVQEMAHRVSYRLFVGEIPDGLHIDHLCRVRCCVNPLHLEAVSVVENLARGVGPSARAIRENVCVRGHAFTAENTFRKKNGTRGCRACGRKATRAWYDENVRDPSRLPRAMRTQCPHGHPYDSTNTYVRPDGCGRGCRACTQTRNQNKQFRLKGAA